MGRRVKLGSPKLEQGTPRNFLPTQLHLRPFTTSNQIYDLFFSYFTTKKDTQEIGTKKKIFFLIFYLAFITHIIIPRGQNRAFGRKLEVHNLGKPKVVNDLHCVSIHDVCTEMDVYTRDSECFRAKRNLKMASTLCV